MSGLLGLSLIGGSPGGRGGAAFTAMDPARGEALAPVFHAASTAEVDRACALASAAQDALGAVSPAARAAFLDDVAAGLEAGGEALVARAQAETALPRPRLVSELGRTCGQLRLFAEVVREGSWVDARIDTARPDRQPAPRPDLRSMRRPLGPVAVFGASNFPLAFSVAGGDTASALAAGNPVIVKAHPAHPGASELAARAIVEAVREAGLPEGTFSLLFDAGTAVGQALVAHPAIAAVAFTGSRAGGEALVRAAAARPRPIPVFAEMGSVNPVIVLPGALAARSEAIAAGLHASFTLGVGQFCTNPGVVLVPAGAAGDAFVSRLAELTRGTAAGTMLTARIGEAYGEGLRRLGSEGARRVAEGAGGAAAGVAALWEVPGERVLAAPRLLEEVFGPSTLVVRYADDSMLAGLVGALDGQLTATVHAGPGEIEARTALRRQLEGRAGRLLLDQFPTGVEVCPAMVHGGPWPATSDPRATSVGTRAIERFTRLQAWQNWPPAALPDELRDENPRGLLRLVDGRWSTGPLAS